ncbi:MAG TPA: VIT family protein [Candidatus Saccharimonadaceae bacterium]|nr:VIT family protein [Candidatus Saccharimonadaceae bacterium]
MDSSSEAPERSNQMLNRLRAAVLGANDGVVSVSGVVMGVAGATTNQGAIATAGLAALVAGALSMAVGEYVSVSSQSDTEKAYIEKERASLKAHPREEYEELVENYKKRGVSDATAHQVAKELSSKNPLKAHLEVEFGLDENDINSPSQAAIASLVSFTVGGLIPFLAILLAPTAARIPTTVVAVAVALLVTGYYSAHVGGASKVRAVARVLVGGLLAMTITYFVGVLFGAKV